MFNVSEPPEDTDPPAVSQWLQELSFDVLCVFEGARWDAFAATWGEPLPAASPGANPLGWFQQLPETDPWPEVTYLFGGTTDDGLDGDKIPEEMLPVEEIVDASQASHPAYGRYTRTVEPTALTEMAQDYEPPMVIHYRQPAPPFIGQVSVTAPRNHRPDRPGSIAPEADGTVTERHQSLVDEKLISPSVYQAAYLTNLKLLSWELETLGDTYDEVAITGTHGMTMPAEDNETSTVHWHGTDLVPVVPNASTSLSPGVGEQVSKTRHPDPSIQDQSAVRDKLESLGYHQ